MRIHASNSLLCSMVFRFRMEDCTIENAVNSIRHLLRGWKADTVREAEFSLIEPAFIAGVLVVFVVSLIMFKNPLPGAVALCSMALLLFLGAAPKRLLYFLIVYSMVVKFLIGDMGIPSVANYVSDSLLMLMILLALRSPREGYIPSRRFKRVGIVVLVFWLVATASALLNEVSFILYIWACRNTFRLFGTLFCCVRLLDRDDVYGLVRFFVGFFWVNLIVCAFQYFVLGTAQDNTNGFFGTGSGGNAMMVILLFAVSAFSLFGYALHRKTMAELAITLVACCFLAAIAELKIYYILLILLIVLSTLLNKPSFRSVAIAVLFAMALFAGIQMLTFYNPEFSEFFSIENIIKSSSEGSYSSEGTLNRLTAVQTIDAMFLNGWLASAFGLGFGAGQYTQFFESLLYAIWGEVLHWTWFTDAAVFLETGYVGLIAYVMAFVLIAAQAVRMRKRSEADSWLVAACASIAVLCLILIVYNCSLTVDPSCYFIGVLLAFPYILETRAQ